MMLADLLDRSAARLQSLAIWLRARKHDHVHQVDAITAQDDHLWGIREHSRKVTTYADDWPRCSCRLCSLLIANQTEAAYEKEKVDPLGRCSLCVNARCQEGSDA